MARSLCTLIFLPREGGTCSFRQIRAAHVARRRQRLLARLMATGVAVIHSTLGCHDAPKGDFEIL